MVEYLLALIEGSLIFEFVGDTFLVNRFDLPMVGRLPPRRLVSGLSIIVLRDVFKLRCLLRWFLVVYGILVVTPVRPEYLLYS